MARRDVGRRLLGLVRAGLRAAAPIARPKATRPTAGRTTAVPSRPAAPRRPASPGHRSGTVRSDEIGYRPRADGSPDPGEVVWAWVAFEEGDGRGKDRPVLIIGRRGDDLLGLMLTSKDHDRDAADEARHGRFWTDVGSGDWDPQGRPSEVRLDRLLVLAPVAVRREGAALDRARFDRVVAEAARVQGW
jgi:hypothetical protein